MPRTRINFISWLWSLAVWDGLLPVGIVLLPMLVQFLFPNSRGPIEWIAVVVPIVALLLRIPLAIRGFGRTTAPLASNHFN